MMLDIDLAELRQEFCASPEARLAHALAVIVEIAGVVWARGGLGVDASRGGTPTAADPQQHARARTRLLYAAAPIRSNRRDVAAGRDRRGHPRTSPCAAGPGSSSRTRTRRSPCVPRIACASSRWTRRSTAISPRAAAGLSREDLFWPLSVAGIFLNRKNVLLLLMCVELLLLAANFNFIAFSRYLGDLNGQVFVFFVLTVAAESAIGLAILVVLFRERPRHPYRRPEHAERLRAHPMNPNVLLAIALLPLLASIIAGLFGRYIGRVGAHLITIGAVAPRLLAVPRWLGAVLGGVPSYDGPVYTWPGGDGMGDAGGLSRGSADGAHDRGGRLRVAVRARVHHRLHAR